MDLTMMERVGDRWEKMEGSCSTGQSQQWAVVPMEEEEVRVFVALGVQHAIRMRHVATCGLSDSKIFSHIIT
jgi:hypothetical protein